MLDSGFIGKQKRPSKRVGEQFAAKVINKIIFALFTDVALHTLELRSPHCRRERRPRVSTGPAAEVIGSLFADRTVAFEREAEGVEARMAGSATRVLAVLCQHVPQRQIELRLVLGQLGNVRRRRRDHLAEDAPHDPISPLHRTRPQAG